LAKRSSIAVRTRQEPQAFEKATAIDPAFATAYSILDLYAERTNVDGALAGVGVWCRRIQTSGAHMMKADVLSCAAM
jgi:hypothetical protein